MPQPFWNHYSEFEIEWTILTHHNQQKELSDRGFVNPKYKNIAFNNK